MSKYTLLMLLNTPFALYGIGKSILAYKQEKVKLSGLIIRLAFWAMVLVGLWFAEEIYEFLVVKGLTDSTPLSIADVVLVTGLCFCMFLILRLYSKIDKQANRLTELHEKLSIKLSKNDKS